MRESPGPGDRRLAEGVELALARASLVTKSDSLWSVIEAAQYASLILQDPEAQGPDKAVDAFVQAFSALIETWNEGELRNKGSLIAAVLARTNALADAGVFVHWGVARRKLANAGGKGEELPVAVVWLDRNESASITVELPDTLAIDSDDESDE